MSLEDLHFLIVDDMPVMCKVNVDTLRALGARRITTAANGREALDIIRSQTVDFVLSDWNMPLMSGLELLRAVREGEQTCATPFLMITAEVERSRIAEAIVHGVSDLLVKPYTTQRLHDKILAVLLRQERRAAGCAEPPAAAAPEIPAVPPRAPFVPPAFLPGSDAPALRGTILAVDDVADNLRLISHQFEGRYRVRIAHNGEKALAICTSDDPPDLVLLDVMMPGMSGFELAERMREHPASAGIPVIFITTLDSQEARRHGLQLGAMDFVSKPIDPDLLAMRVHNFMRYVELNKQRQADYDEMLAAARLREEVDRMLRHDLKGPLAGVLALAQQMRADPAITVRQDDQAAMMESSVGQVLDIIDLASVVFKIETGRHHALQEPVALGELLQQVAALARLAYGGKGLTLEVEAAVGAGNEVLRASGDATLCRAAFHNLVKNAAEAAPFGSTIAVRLHDRTPLLVTVENRGAVPEDMRGKLFTKYATSKRGGTGLGTYSAKLMLEAQGGGIRCDTSGEDNRTTMHVTLPRWDMFDGAFG